MILGLDQVRAQSQREMEMHCQPSASTVPVIEANQNDWLAYLHISREHGRKI